MGWGQDWDNAVMKGLKFIQGTGTETGNKVQHMTTGAIQEQIGPWTSRWQVTDRGGRLGLLPHSPGRGCCGQEWRKVPGVAAQVPYGLWAPTGPWYFKRKPSWMILPISPNSHPKDVSTLVFHPPPVTTAALTWSGRAPKSWFWLDSVLRSHTEAR